MFFSFLYLTDFLKVFALKKLRGRIHFDYPGYCICTRKYLKNVK